MANISESKVEGVSYTYDSESRNPLGLKAKIRMWSGALVYDKDTKAPTEILEGVPVPAGVAKPVISITSEGKVTITCATSGATIYYTTDNSEPSKASTEYADAFTLDDSATVKAIAYAEIDGEEKVSAVASKAYTKQDIPTPPPSGDNKIYFLQYLAAEEEEIEDEAMLANLTEDMLNGTVPVSAVSPEDGKTYSYTAKPVATSAGKFTNLVDDSIEVTGDAAVSARCLYAWDPTVYTLTEALDNGLKAPAGYTPGIVGKYAVALFSYSCDPNAWGHILTFENA
jgi:hypothetical protein